MNARRRPSWGSLAATLGYMGGIFLVSSLPGSWTGPNTPTWHFVSNAFHIPLFAGLGICLGMTMARWPWPSRGIGTLAIGLAYAVSDEWHQSLVPGRSAAMADLVLDAAGIALAVVVLWRLSRRHATPPGWVAR